MPHNKLRRCTDDADDEVDVFAQAGYSDDEDDEDIKEPKQKLEEDAEAKENIDVQETGEHPASPATTKSTSPAPAVRGSRKRGGNRDNKRVDNDIHASVSENAPYFQHERRQPEPDGQKELQRRFVFHADEEEKEAANTAQPKPVSKGEKERWTHDWYERLQAGEKTPGLTFRRGREGVYRRRGGPGRPSRFIRGRRGGSNR